MKKAAFLTAISEASENVYLFLSVSWLVSFGVFIYNNISLMYKYLLELVKRRSKVQEKKISCECAVNFDQWKTFPGNNKPINLW